MFGNVDTLLNPKIKLSRYPQAWFLPFYLVAMSQMAPAHSYHIALCLSEEQWNMAGQWPTWLVRWGGGFPRFKAQQSWYDPSLIRAWGGRNTLCGRVFLCSLYGEQFGGIYQNFNAYILSNPITQNFFCRDIYKRPQKYMIKNWK